MILTAQTKKEIFKKHGGNEKNTGASESQIALFTQRIEHLSGHLSTNKKDFGTQRALLNLVGKRRALLDYLKRTELEKYRALIKTLDIRK
ncbi:MAG TPA: 30S ribosomal protein S15 [Bacteroidia bacterium]|jgi:small subunit ribosomal protein S15|nr:30S ribosomal protein S15 [Bacteroidia bacterium]